MLPDQAILPWAHASESKAMPVVSAIIGLFALLSLVLTLKRTGLLNPSHGQLFSQLVTRVTLPALIFHSLNKSHLVWSEAEISLVMLLVTLVCLVLGWLVARGLNLDGPGKAAVILASGFGSSSSIGFTIVEQVFPGNAEALTQAVIISSLGVQPALFTLGTAIAMAYGERRNAIESPWQSAVRYLKSPIFIAFAGGVAASLVTGGQPSPLLNVILKPIHLVAHANAFLVIAVTGLSLQLKEMGNLMTIGACVAIIKLIAMPLLLWLFAHLLMTPEDWQLEILMIEGSMSSALLAVVLCSAYGCDAKLAAKLVAITLTLSLVTTPTLTAFLR
ncbi:MAG: AEC family transporter [Luteolibacter sp.]